MSMESNKLKEFIDEIIQEIEKDLDEATTSGAAGAYSTPGAFSDNGAKDKKQKKKIATQLGMKLVGKVNESSTISKQRAQAELKQKLKGKRSDGMGKYTATIYGMDGSKRIELKSLNDLNQFTKFEIGEEEANEKVNFVVLYKNKNDKNTITRSNNFNTKSDGSKFLKSIKNKGGDGFVVKKADASKLRLTTQKEWDTAKRKLGLKESESVNEVKKPQGPVNRWLAIKNDESKHPHKKMAMGLKELKYQLGETQKFFNWYNQIKSMNELDSSDYWKRTNKHIYKIKERLINIAKTIQEIEK